MRDNFATWEGAKILIARVKDKKITIEPFQGGRQAFLKESMKYPVGLIIQHGYDTRGRGGNHPESLAVYYKGRNVEVAPAEDLDHPYINRLENMLSFRGQEDDYNERDYAVGVTYEKPDVDEFNFRKKKPAKSKPKRPVKKVIKKKVIRKKK